MPKPNILNPGIFDLIGLVIFQKKSKLHKDEQIPHQQIRNQNFLQKVQFSYSIFNFTPSTGQDTVTYTVKCAIGIGHSRLRMRVTADVDIVNTLVDQQSTNTYKFECPCAIL